MKETVDKFGSQPALSVKVNNVWESMTWNEYYEQVLMAGRAFMALGLEK